MERSGAGWRLILLALCATFALALGAATASAASYLEVGTFAGGGPGPGGSGSGNGELFNPGQADVNDASGNLYVADTGNDRVEVFKPTATAGEYDSQAAIPGATGLAIDQSDGSVYVSTPTGIGKYDAALAPVGAGWTDPGVTGALAVDPATGDLLVADTGANLVRRFNSDGSADGSFAAERPVDVAANSAGDVFVVTTTGDLGNYPCGSTSTVERFDSAGSSQGALVGVEIPGAVAVDPDDDSIVVADRVNAYFCNGSDTPRVVRFDAAGTLDGAVSLASETLYAAVPGLAVQGGGSARAYAITKSPANDTFGATRATVLEIPEPTAPEIVGQSALRGGVDATLRASIDAGGLATEYHFEYGLSTSYGVTTPIGVLPVSFEPAAVSAAISGLAPGTTYHYRVVAENSLGAVQGQDRTFTTESPRVGCPNEAFRTGAAAFLTDCRAYELVTPFGSDADIRIGGGPSTPDGSVVCFNTEDPLADADPNGIKTADQGFCAWREPSGWRTEWVTGPRPAERQSSMGSEVYFLSPDARRAVFASDAALFGRESIPPTPSPYGPPMSSYMWEGGQTTWLAPAAPPVGDPPQYEYEGKHRPLDDNEWGSNAGRRPVAVSTDLTHGIFESDLPILPADQNEVVDVYEWYPGGLRVVSTDADGKAAGGRTGIQKGVQYLAPFGAISADGSRVFFQHDGAPLVGDSSEAPEGIDPESHVAIQSVYMREGDEITLVSPRRGSGPDQSVWFAGAPADGDAAYLETPQQLTPESKEPGKAIYRYDVAGDELELVADAPGGVRFLGVSPSGSTFLYWELVSKQLIVVHNGVAEAIGTLAESDYVGPFDTESPHRVASSRLDRRGLRFTPDGSAIVFAGAGEFGGFGPGPVQIYRWTAGTGVERLSAPDGATPTANASIGAYPALTGDPREELFLTHRAQGNYGRVISDDGSRVFFETPEPLVNRDINGLTDVYEWHNGEIDLVSTGTQGKAFYHESSADGKTVFFTTFDKLLPQWDRNSRRDLYVARPDGGLPPPPSPPDCAGEACQSPPRSAPAASDPASDSGEGNAVARRALAHPAALKRKQLAKLADGGAASLRVKVAMPGRVTASLKGKVGGRVRTVAKASRMAQKPGTVSLRLKLSKPALKAIAKKGKLRLTLVVAHSGSQLTEKRELVLHD